MSSLYVFIGCIMAYLMGKPKLTLLLQVGTEVVSEIVIFILNTAVNNLLNKAECASQMAPLKTGSHQQNDRVEKDTPFKALSYRCQIAICGLG